VGGSEIGGGDKRLGAAHSSPGWLFAITSALRHHTLGLGVWAQIDRKMAWVSIEVPVKTIFFLVFFINLLMPYFSPFRTHQLGSQELESGKIPD